MLMLELSTDLHVPGINSTRSGDYTELVSLSHRHFLDWANYYEQR